LERDLESDSVPFPTFFQSLNIIYHCRKTLELPTSQEEQLVAVESERKLPKKERCMEKELEA